MIRPPHTRAEPSDHQIIRALSRTSRHNNGHPNRPQAQIPSHHHHSSIDSHPSLDIQPGPLSPTNPHFNNIRSTTNKLLRSISPHPSVLPPPTTTAPPLHTCPLNPTQHQPHPPILPSHGTIPQHKTLLPTTPLRSNSISSICPRRQHQHHPRTHPHPSSTIPTCSSTDSINTHSSNPLRSKLERQFSKLTHRFNQHSTTHPTSKPKPPYQSNRNRSCSGSRQKLPHPQPKLKSSSSSSLSSLFEQAITRARHHHPNHKRDCEPPKTVTGTIPSSPKTPPPPRSASVVSNAKPTQAPHHLVITADRSSSEHTSRKENAPVVLGRTSARYYDPSKRSPHTIYLPIEHGPCPLIASSPNLQSIHKPSMLTSTHIKVNKFDKRQSPTQIALSRLDEILRGHHRSETTELTPTEHHEHMDLYYGCQSISGNLANPHPIPPTAPPSTNSNHILPHPTSPFSPILGLSVPHSLSPPLRARKKTQQKKSPSHHHSQSLNDHHVLIDPETWKSISFSTSKYHQHPLRTLD